MAININNLSNNNQVNRTVQQQQNDVKNQVDQKAVNTSQATRVSQDSVSLTPQARQLNDIQKKNGDAPPVNQRKVDQLKEAIQSGAYKVDAEKLAQSIAKFEFDLL
ncbi:flagellar biosynthesis anti-sigma factor FlgM [Thalassotalea euphylliae]|uniref:Negative regulator of flagellin synthesis n=1 Tax=Thalassotalea euphylliae TaxID=1655234 RepID=A0A3E0UD76_9GAMM|nr:flagellar biosynthesis anti-sigma factor FlgM [Thalassotalea euphylliae]REL34780.1 flagellar biosynthesis anti-sigma factor FlgM [Thalassotalea euphylliae]